MAKRPKLDGIELKLRTKNEFQIDRAQYIKLTGTDLPQRKSYLEKGSAVAKLAAKYGIETIELDRGYESTLSDFNTDAYRFIAGAVETVFPDVKACPYIMTGASDARYMSRVCSNCFRFLPFEIDHQQMESIHGIDENVFVKSLPGAVQFFKYVIKEA